MSEDGNGDIGDDADDDDDDDDGMGDKTSLERLPPLESGRRRKERSTNSMEISLNRN